MPRWGPLRGDRVFPTMADCLDFMEGMLKGLMSMHLHRIVHRDLRAPNAVIDHYQSEIAIPIKSRQSTRDLFGGKGSVIYNIIDFDYALTIPPNCLYREAEESLATSRRYPRDTRQGELEYNPFAYDVGALGMMFCDLFQDLILYAPMMARLFDMMVTSDVSRRFTAAEALHFFQHALLPGMSDEQLAMAPPPLSPYRVVTFEDDRWAGLPSEFVAKWGEHRAPSPSRMTLLLRRICRREWGYPCVRATRRIVRFIVYHIHRQHMFIWTLYHPSAI